MVNACAAITALSLRHQNNANAVVLGGGANLIVKAMVMHPTSTRLQSEACR
jgi:hypothetical protein